MPRQQHIFCFLLVPHSQRWFFTQPLPFPPLISVVFFYTFALELNLFFVINTFGCFNYVLALSTYRLAYKKKKLMQIFTEKESHPVYRPRSSFPSSDDDHPTTNQYTNSNRRISDFCGDGR